MRYRAHHGYSDLAKLPRTRALALGRGALVSSAVRMFGEEAEHRKVTLATEVDSRLSKPCSIPADGAVVINLVKNAMRRRRR